MVLGNLLGAVAHFLLSAEGPLHGVPQMVLGRLAFGHNGNILPATFMAVMCGVGWFATNSVSGAFALATLLGITPLAGLIVIVVLQTAFAFFGHNLVQRFERLAAPILAIVFLIGAVIIFSKSDVSAGSAEGGFSMGGFLLAVGASFGYTAGWTPYAADYTRYLPPTVSKMQTGLFASAGLFLSCTLLMVVGAASMTIGAPTSDNPTDAFTANFPSAIADLTLLAIAVGAIAANAINVYSGAMAFVTMGFKLPVGAQRHWCRCSSVSSGSSSPGGRWPTLRPPMRRSCCWSRTGSVPGSAWSSPTVCCDASRHPSNSSTTASTPTGVVWPPSS